MNNIIDIINNTLLTNLLINSNFRNPINQRGKTVYNTIGYSIDRWILQNANTTLAVNDGYCTLAGEHNVLVQNIEFPTLYSNKEVTLSAKVKGSGGGINLVLYSAELDKILASKTIDTTEWQEINVSCTIGTLTNDSKRLSVSIEGAGANSIDIEWVKLELGSVATPFISRSFGEELLLCQSYLQSDNVFVSNIEPDKDGLWINTSQSTFDNDGENIIVKQIKKYMNDKIGDLSKLNTNVKDNLVHAVNSINKNISQMEQSMYQININYFPRLNDEIDDAPRFNRAMEYIKNRGGGTLKLNSQRYYLRTRHSSESFFQLFSNVNINGAGDSSIFYIDDNSESGLHGMLTSLDLHDAKYSNFSFDTSLRSNWNDTDFYDGFYIRYTVKDVNITFENINFHGKHYQSCINLSHVNYDEYLPESEYGNNIQYINCSFFQTTYPAITNNVLFKNCVWNMDLDVKRPTWIDGSSQSAFKATGRHGFINNFNVIDCKIVARGTRNPIVPFEVFRTNSCLIENLVIDSEKDGYCIIDSSAIKDYRTVDKETKCIIRDSDFRKISIYYGELSDVLIENTIFGGRSNTLYSIYKEEDKQTSLPYAQSKLKAVNCTFLNDIGRISLNESGETNLQLENCIIYYDRTKSSLGGITNSEKANVIINSCKFYISNNGSYCFNINKINQLIVKDNVFLKDNGFSSESDTIIGLSGVNNNIIISNNWSEVHVKNRPLVELINSASIIGVRNIQNEKLELLANGNLYEITINIDGQLIATQK